MLRSAFNLFFLRGLSWSSFNFPRWQALLAITLIGILVGFYPDLTGMPAKSFGITVPFSLLLVLVYFSISVGFLRWWMQRGGRWDGQGDMFNLVVAAGLVVNMLYMGLDAVGMPALLLLLLALYSIWVGGNALSAAIPKASLAYSIGGCVISSILVCITLALVMVLIIFALEALGVTSPLLG
jgi:hypothetical protein